jgi:hypothetical protein
MDLVTLNNGLLRAPIPVLLVRKPDSANFLHRCTNRQPLSAEAKRPESEKVPFLLVKRIRQAILDELFPTRAH